jgi:teichuronic acid biosynthesis glycosyltransferase TuaC
MKIARIFTGDLNNRKGKFNNVVERIKHLQNLNSVESDNYLIHFKYQWPFNLFKNKRYSKEEYIELDGVAIKVIYVRLTLMDYIGVKYLKLRDTVSKKEVTKYTDLFKSYDVVLSHDLLSSTLASSVKNEYNIPFVITWHGSDINIHPYRNKHILKSTKHLLEHADFNFFVSKALMKNSENITVKSRSTHLYSGPSDNFNNKMSPEKIKRIKDALKIKSTHVVGFIGNLENVKNVLVLPEVFRKVKQNLDDVSFVIIGDGRLAEQLINQMQDQDVKEVLYTGKVTPEEIPDYLNTFNVLLLPSLNEGMPMVILEAQASGVHVVGSDVGGIPEAIGSENSFPLNQDFVENIANRTIELLTHDIMPLSLPEEFSWDKTVEKEVLIYKKIQKGDVDLVDI